MAVSVKENLTTITHSEFFMVMSHYYRGEMHRMNAWRDRIDRTTNWALTVLAGVVSVAFSERSVHHVVLLLLSLVIFLLLAIESRRYRFFDMVRHRIRILEKNFLVPIISPNATFREDLMEEVARSLAAPNYHISTLEAMGRRLKRNYIWIFLLLMLSWIMHVTLYPTRIHTLSGFLDHARVGMLSGLTVIIIGGSFYAFLLALTLRAVASKDEEDGRAHL
jgi:uncharacterized membrane protein